MGTAAGVVRAVPATRMLDNRRWIRHGFPWAVERTAEQRCSPVAQKTGWGEAGLVLKQTSQRLLAGTRDCLR